MWDNNSNLQQHISTLIQQGDLSQGQGFQTQLTFLQTHPRSPQECAAECVEELSLMMTTPAPPPTLPRMHYQEGYLGRTKIIRGIHVFRAS